MWLAASHSGRSYGACVAAQPVQSWAITLEALIELECKLRGGYQLVCITTPNRRRDMRETQQSASSRLLSGRCRLASSAS